MTPQFLAVVTPSVRTGNLSVLAVSVERLREQLRWRVDWLVFLDRSVPLVAVPGAAAVARQSSEGCFGNAGRNDALDRIREGWVWFLDDDNDIHPAFAAGLLASAAEHPDAEGFVFDQLNADGSLRLRAKLDAELGEVDTAQFVFRRGAIGSHRWRVDEYTADGEFFAEVSREIRGRGALRAAVSGAVWYNKLRK